jgi:fatty acid amide hydrolase
VAARARCEFSCRTIVHDIFKQIEANKKLKAVVQPLAEQARHDAERIDAEGHDGPLAGVPITIKDCFDVAGTTATLGMSHLADNFSQLDSPLVRRLRAAGAIIVGKTNVPQGMMLHECANPVFGRTRHPLRKNRSPGGSSGGEAAAVASFCSAIGLGSDLGGSIRQPAHSCGLFGIKPTSDRLTLVGSHVAQEALFGITMQAGPLARCTDDLDLMLRALTDFTHIPRQTDEVDRPWPDFRAVDTQGLRIAWWNDDGYFAPAPAIARATREAGEYLVRNGVEVVTVEPPEIDRAMRLFLGLIGADGLRSMREAAGHDKLDWEVRRQMWLGRISGWPRRLLGRVLDLSGQPTLGKLLASTGPRTASEIAAMQADMNDYRATFWESLEQATGGPVDAVLTPPHALVALRHGSGLDLLPAASYAYLPNLLGAPAGVAPWTMVREDEQHYTGSRWDIALHRAHRNSYHSAGLPVGVQVFARDWREDVVLAVLKTLEAGRAEGSCQDRLDLLDKSNSRGATTRHRA